MDIGKLDYRQYLVDAAVEEMSRQLGSDHVTQHGTRVDFDGSIKMARVLEAVFRAMFDRSDAMVEEIARSLAPAQQSWEEYRGLATDAVSGMTGFLLDVLDPLP